MLLKDKVSIVTGAGRGIGKSIAAAFASEGAAVILVARNPDQLAAVERELQGNGRKVRAFPADVSRQRDVQGIVDFTLGQFGTVDILVNSAGIYGPIGPATEVDTVKWIEAINVNLCGTFMSMKAVLPTMVRNRKGKIVNLSGGGAASPFPRFSAYSASKAAVVRLTETLAEEVREYGIDINAIAPGAVNTRLLDQVLQSGEAAGRDFLAKSKKQKHEGGVPAEKVAELAVFLASPQSDGLSGRLISLVWDNWKGIPAHVNDIMSSDVYTLRRIVPSDRGFDW